MALTEKDIAQLKLIIEAAMSVFSGEISAMNQKIDGLEKLFVEKLNGHGGAVERLEKDLDHLFTLDRERVKEISDLRSDHEALKTKVEGNRQIVEQKEGAVENVKNRITAAHLAWVGAGAGLLGALGAVLLQWILSGGK